MPEALICIIPILFLAFPFFLKGVFYLIGSLLNYLEIADEKQIQNKIASLRFLEKFKSIFFDNSSSSKIQNNFHHREIMKVLLGLDEESLEELLQLYKKQFGKGAARYAGRTYRKWETGKVRPTEQTFRRFLVHLPKVMSYDLKCEVLRHLMEEYSQKDEYNLTVYTDNWEKTLEPLVRQIIDKPYNATLPAQIEDRLKWLADDEMQIAENILKKSQIEEGKVAVSMLRDEFENIEKLLTETEGKSKVTHALKFPYGTINLEIKRR